MNLGQKKYIDSLKDLFLDLLDLFQLQNLMDLIPRIRHLSRICPWKVDITEHLKLYKSRKYIIIMKECVPVTVQIYTSGKSKICNLFYIFLIKPHGDS